MIPADFLEAIHDNALTDVRAGGPEREFLDIWAVDVRGGLELGVYGIIPPDIEDISHAISAEYLRKYDSGANSVYARGIVLPEHVARTMEFVPVNERVCE